jgi:hypothetical protein
MTGSAGAPLLCRRPVPPRVQVTAREALAALLGPRFGRLGQIGLLPVRKRKVASQTPQSPWACPREPRERGPLIGC